MTHPWFTSAPRSPAAPVTVIAELQHGGVVVRRSLGVAVYIPTRRDVRDVRDGDLEQTGPFGERTEVPVLVPRLGDTVGEQQ